MTSGVPRTEEGVRYYDFAGQGSLTKLLTGVVIPRDRSISVVTPAGTDRYRLMVPLRTAYTLAS